MVFTMNCIGYFVLFNVRNIDNVVNLDNVRNVNNLVNVGNVVNVRMKIILTS